MGINFGYIRVSTNEQNLDRQLEVIESYVTNERYIYSDKASGKDMEREGFVFHKDEKENRTYTDTNISIFRRIIDAKNKPSITLVMAIKGVIPMYMKDFITPCVTEISTKNKDY